MYATVHKTFNAARHPHPDKFASLPSLELDPAGEAVHLQGRQHMRLHRARGWTVHALAGSVWITQDGDIRDIVLQAGQSFVLDRDGPALLSPLKEAQVCISHGIASDAAPSRTRLMRRPLFATHASYV